MKNEEFFIGWESKPDPGIRNFLRSRTVLLMVLALILALMLAFFQKTIGNGVFEFGNLRDFSGVLIQSPTPMLVADEPTEGERIFYLVAPFKYGFPKEEAAKYHLHQVKLQGTLIHNELEAMIEVAADSVESEGQVNSAPLEEGGAEELVTLRGEIVDSKCHLGVMNPGSTKTHRACAIHCIAGGIPPLLVVRSTNGMTQHLLVGPEGEPINEAILDFVAEPVEVSGQRSMVGDRSVLKIDPQTIKRLDE
ncbi:MAG: hypothetical protein AAF514_13725 [Verrucomicrobiota bacterium]